jgi:ATP-binding cassette, subfamily B, bacterial MsbA
VPESTTAQTSLADPARKLFGFVRPHKWGLLASTLAFLLASATEPLIPILLTKVLDKGFSSELPFPIWIVPMGLIVLFAARGFFTFCGSYLLSRVASRTVLDVRTALIQSLIRADARLYARVSPAEAVSKVVSNPQEMTGLMGGAFTTILRDGTTTLAMLGYLFYANWKLTLIALITLPLLSYAVRRIHKRVKSLGGQAYDSQMRLVSVVDDIARAWRVVRTFDAGEWETQRFRLEAAQLQRLTLKNAASSALMSPVSQLIASFGVATILTLALVHARQDGTTVGEFAGFITAMLLLVSKARHLSDVSQPIVAGLVVARGCFELLDAPAESDTGTTVLQQCQGSVRLHNLTVIYPQAPTPALDCINLTIEAGQTIALVGASGSGKTTVVNSLLGFLHPESGQILLDGIDIGKLRKSSLRKQFAVVSQDIVLFDGSMADNVAYAQTKDSQRLEQCLKAANLWEFVSAQPDGMEASIGANGSKLSGGQRQRLAIARALYKDAKIWVFDEATSALDTESERVVQQSIEQWHGNKTLVLIAHRLSTVRRADCIYVLSQGRVAESGRHEDLMTKDGLYASMVRAQAME